MEAPSRVRLPFRVQSFAALLRSHYRVEPQNSIVRPTHCHALQACAIIACMPGRKMGQGTLFEGREVIDVPENDSLDLILEQLRASPCGECKPGMPLIFGEGPAPSNIMLVGEGAGLDDVGPQRPFQGPSGVMLERMMGSIGVRVSNCYTTNVIKCIPPRERNFSIEEIEACRPFLLRQILAVDPQMIIAFGALAAQTILRSRLSISNLRGRVFDFVINDRRIVLVPTVQSGLLDESAGEET